MRLEQASKVSQLWYPGLAMILDAPFATWLQGVTLHASIQPVFPPMLGGISAVGLTGLPHEQNPGG